MSLKIKKTVDLNLVVHQFVKTTKANYRTMLKVSQNGNTIQHLSFLPSKKKAKHIMVNMKSTPQPKQNIPGCPYDIYKGQLIDKIHKRLS